MLSDQEMADLADPEFGQHFLVSAGKLSQLVAAAGIRPTDDVLEAGAGIGTVAKLLPLCRSLTVVELDSRLIGYLRENVPNASVVQGDALEVIQHASFDVLIGNLPHAVTDSLLKLLPGLSFRTAVMAVSTSSDLDQLGPAFSWSEVTRITGDDFVPPQAGRVAHREGSAHCPLLPGLVYLSVLFLALSYGWVTTWAGVQIVP